MAPTIRIPRILISLCLVLVAASMLPYSISAAPLAISPALPDLSTFASSLQNGNGNVLRGAYASGLFAFPVLQQPASKPGYVFAEDKTLTQFKLVNQFGNIGLLAHDNLSGKYFSQITVGQSIQLVYGDGRIEYFRAMHVYSFQAVSPFSVNSDFIDLNTQERLSAGTLFYRVYGGSRHVTFQTCIARNGNSSWGRLFIIAVPETSPSAELSPSAGSLATLSSRMN